MRAAILFVTLALFATAIYLWTSDGTAPPVGPAANPDQNAVVAADPASAALAGAEPATATDGDRTEVRTESNDSTAPVGDVHGSVVDHDGRPVAGARVFLTSRPTWFRREAFLDPTAVPERYENAPRTETDEQGRFHLTPTAADEPQVVTVVPRRHAPDHVDAPATAGREVDVGTIEVELGVRITGKVVDASGEPAADARVRVVGQESAMIFGGPE
ncbi:MAG: hypothetical protein KDB80_02580, partial [Planctomycetes bacterium]|nr:hypothetical protein [Planctomycetota bacterium]